VKEQTVMEREERQRLVKLEKRNIKNSGMREKENTLIRKKALTTYEVGENSLMKEPTCKR
jgi:hypothetical protein